RVADLEAQLAAMSIELQTVKTQPSPEIMSELGSRDQMIEELRHEIETLKASKASSADENVQIQQYRIEAEAVKADLKQAESAIVQLSDQIKEKDLQLQELKLAALEPVSNVADESGARVIELEQDIETLRNLLAEKDEALAAQQTGGPVIDPMVTAELDAAKAEIEMLKSRMADLQNAAPTLPAGVAEELDRLREENTRLAELEQKIATLQADSDQLAETAMRLTAAESEREQLAAQVEKLSNQGESAQEQSLKLEIAKLKQELTSRDGEVARLRVSIEARGDDSMSDPALREEVEQLTRQVADQLLAIQNFEGMLNKAKEQIDSKNLEIDSLRSRVSQTSQPQAVIPVSGDSEIISGFIDFFDGLDSLLARNPLPELQSLHQKLLDRLIIPNQINYFPVISEEFDPEKHIATDYFRSDRFPERCVVFEVEKGYAKGDSVIKKSKVWVVQNLFNCMECNAMQSNSDSRFCHMCGAKMVAPNGLPVDSLPEFSPTPATYQRFAERMIDKGEIGKAKEYLQSGLELDASFVPLLVKLGDLKASESKYEEALELLNKAFNLKQDAKVQEKIKAIEVKLNIFKQAQSLKLDPEEFSKLVNLIQK
ncbi:MAG: nucleotide exchange factor GrpE, partial [Candidatus Riflebacteria bacterium]